MQFFYCTSLQFNGVLALAASAISTLVLLLLSAAVAQDFDYGDFGYPNALSNGIGIDPDLGLRFDAGPFAVPREPVSRQRARQPQRPPNVVVILADDMVRRFHFNFMSFL